MNTKTIVSRIVGSASGLWAITTYAHPHPAGTPAAEQLHWHAELGVAIALLVVVLAAGLRWRHTRSRVSSDHSRHNPE